MWPHEDLPHRPGKALETDQNLRYLAPGAFTILPPEAHAPPPDFSQPTTTHRLTPTARKHRDAAFTIIAEASSLAGSRSPSPTGRVSPFRGRGFNSTGSRHASPLPSPPPEEQQKPSRIPTRRDSVSALGGVKVQHGGPRPRGTLAKQMSQSLTDISPSRRPPQSPRKGRPRAPAFHKLSPIVGSSPEPLPPSPHTPMAPSMRLRKPQPQSSPSRIPRSRSQPPSAAITPIGSRAASRAASRNASRNPSREPSPAKRPNYKSVRAKVNSFSKPQVPPKPQVPRGTDSVSDNNSSSSTSNFSTSRRKTETATRRVDSVAKKTGGVSKKNGGDATYRKERRSDEDEIRKADETSEDYLESSETDQNVATSSDSVIKKIESNPKLLDLLGPSTTAVVSSTTTTVTQPLKIEAKMDVMGDGGDSAVYLPDTRTLSATSVSTALNRMNDTVLDSKTLMRETNLSSRLPSATMTNKNGNGVDGAKQAASTTTNSTTTNSTTTNSTTTPNTGSAAAIKSATGTNGATTADNGSAPVNNTTISKPTTATVNNASTNGNNNAISTNNSTSTANDSATLNKPPTTAITSNTATSVTNNSNVNHSETTAPNAATLRQNSSSVLVPVEVVKANELAGKNGVSPDAVVRVTDSLPKSANERIKEQRTMVANDVRPIRITVQEKPSSIEVQSGNIRVPVSATNGVSERPGLPPSQPPPEDGSQTQKQGLLERFRRFWRRAPKTSAAASPPAASPPAPSQTPEKKRRFRWPKRTRKAKEPKAPKEPKQPKESKERKERSPRSGSDSSLLQEERQRRWWRRMRFFKRKKVADAAASRKQSWAERTDSFISAASKRSPKNACKRFFRTIFCVNACSRRRTRKIEEEAVKRRSSVMSKKKSLTPPAAPVEVKPKLDAGLVEHTSLMKAAIPVLPVPLAWICLVLNVILPGIGTIVSGFLTLCVGKPRFSTSYGMKQKVGACIIDFFIGCGQLFTVLFCLVGWGWSLWWGVIMIKLAKKHRKIRRAEEAMEADAANQASEAQRDLEKGA